MHAALAEEKLLRPTQARFKATAGLAKLPLEAEGSEGCDRRRRRCVWLGTSCAISESSPNRTASIAAVMAPVDEVTFGRGHTFGWCTYWPR
jgi:hypothetical protein